MPLQRNLSLHHYNTAKYQKAFTLIELLVTVAIIGILTSIAIPNYTDYVLRARITEATSNLSDWRNRIERFYQDNRTYLNAGGGCGVNNPANVNPNPDLNNFTYTCVGTAQTYTLTATGTAAQGMNGFSYTINQNNVKTSTARFSGTNSTSAICWLTRNGGC